ncbi:hypothetical protein BDZ45DRAFT_686298 [Acephala macrosclerotiorum]|nr:hypothetical protein BDZ45DRAFT_686298 [Acephala macrosclerotiorum]
MDANLEDRDLSKIIPRHIRIFPSSGEQRQRERLCKLAETMVFVVISGLIVKTLLPTLASIIQSCLAHSKSTTMDSYMIAPVLAADLPILAHFIFYPSQLIRPTNQFLFSDWPNKSSQVSLYLSSLEKTIDLPHVEMFKVVDNSTGEIVASLILERKTPEIRHKEAPQEPEKPGSNPPGVNAEFYEFVKCA